MKVEFFSASCRLCERTLDEIHRWYPKLDIEIHRADECTDGSCCQLAEKYGIKAVPSLVVNGDVVLVGIPEEIDLKNLAHVLA